MARLTLPTTVGDIGLMSDSVGPWPPTVVGLIHWGCGICGGPGTNLKVGTADCTPPEWKGPYKEEKPQRSTAIFQAHTEVFCATISPLDPELIHNSSPRSLSAAPISNVGVDRAIRRAPF